MAWQRAALRDDADVDQLVAEHAFEHGAMNVGARESTETRPTTITGMEFPRKQEREIPLVILERI